MYLTLTQEEVNILSIKQTCQRCGNEMHWCESCQQFHCVGTKDIIQTCINYRWDKMTDIFCVMPCINNDGGHCVKKEIVIVENDDYGQSEPTCNQMVRRCYKIYTMCS